MKRTTPALLVPLLLCLLLGSALAQAPHEKIHSFAGADHWATIFDDPQRDGWQKPHEVIEALQLAPSMIVADIGAGTGYFAVRVAHMIPTGRVYAVDVEPDMVNYVTERARRANLANVTAVLARTDDPKLPAQIDLALVVDTYHHIDQRESYFRRLRSDLKPGGRVAIIDFKQESPFGPPPRDRILAEDVKKEMAQAGYSVCAEHDFLPNQYFLVFKIGE